MSFDRIRYRFGPFEVDVHRGHLLRLGEPIRLQGQPFQVLVALLERPGDLVTREELRQRLWPADTFVEFDKSLGVALTKVRAALTDGAVNPRFVETVPKRGYRFIAPVTVETSGVQTVTAAATMPAPPRAESAIRLMFQRTAVRTMLGLTAIVVFALAVIAIVKWRSGAGPGVATADRVSVVVAEFDNNTGDDVFVGSLRRAATVALLQSPFISVMADAAIADTLQALGRAPNDTLTAPLARDVCTHAKSTVLVNGVISLAADTYTLVLEATRCTDGGSIARETKSFTKKDDALPALGHAIEQVRTALGESRESLRAYDVPLQIATTDSLAALRAFHLGMDLRSREENVQAISALKTAIALDPRFALAYAQLGSAYSNEGNGAEGLSYLTKAFDLRDRATEPERLYITGRYFDVVTGELEKALDTYRLWGGLYPEDWTPFNAFANDANLIGRYDAAVPAAKRSIALGAEQLFPRLNLIKAYRALNRFREAADAARQVLALAPNNPSAHHALYMIARHASDEAGTEREVAWGAQHPFDSRLLYFEAEDAGLHGRFTALSRLFHESARADRAGGNMEDAGETLAFSAVLNSLAGRTDAAVADARSAAALAQDEIVLGSVGVVEARSGRTGAAEAALTSMARKYPLSIFAIGMYSPMVRGALVTHRSPSQADVTSAMSAALPYELGQEAALQPPYLRGLAYMAAGAPGLAVVEFQKVIDHVGVDPVSPLYAMGYLGVARANAAMGRRDESRRAYAVFLDLWKNADPDVPLLREARREAAVLR
jgi:DNA-binding winged helix-turn-helix (wHTH) protein/tetratricopeptide (TPR) repeat protein